jgi:hypothetical protein
VGKYSGIEERRPYRLVATLVAAIVARERARLPQRHSRTLWRLVLAIGAARA